MAQSIPDQPKSSAHPMDETALIAAIDDSDNRSYGSNLSNLTAALSAERALSIDLYLGKNVDPAPEGQSNVIDRTVFETVQWILPSLCRIFANGDDVVQVVPVSDKDVDGAKQESGYLNWLVTQKHPWFDLFLEWATDALLTKNAYFLVYRDHKRTVEIEKYEAQTKLGLSYLLQDSNVELIDSQQYEAKDLPPEPVLDPQTGQPIVDENGQPIMRPAMLYNCTIRRRNSEKDLCIRVLPPERVKVDQRAFNWRVDEKCNYFEYWEETTLTELREQGFDVPTDIADDPEIYTQEDYARDQYGERRLERYKPSDPSMRRVKARMIWIRCDYNGDGVAELLQVLRVGRRILYKEEVSRIPVASGVACPLPHRHIGISIADMVSDIQRIKTSVMRQGLDNLYLSNNPQKVLNEQVVNIDDALISRPGGIIRATDINQIRHESAPFVFPQAIEALQYLDDVRQNRSGVNGNFQGIDKNSVNNTATGMQVLTTMAAQRVEQIARILAFAIEDLFSIIHEQVLKMGHKQETIMLDGKWVEVDPGSWKKRNSFRICVAFSAGNKDAQMGRLMALLQQQTQAFQLGIPVVTPENYFNTLVELTKSADFAAPERFWTNPANMPPRPPPPPPEGIVIAQMKTASEEKQKAADLIQREVESQRKAELEKYAIDANNAIEIVHKQIAHGHTIAVEGLKASHAAVLSSLGAKLDATHQASKVTSEALADAKGHIASQGAGLSGVHDLLQNVFHEVKKAGSLATAKKVVRKNAKGEIDGVDLIDEGGKVLRSHKAVKDHTGRIVGME